MNDRVKSAETLAADAFAREQALDVTRSFIVQAPAGSGKTELLIQRYLALLACVERPEQIVAMTFTRKAAGEMRERIVAALRDAAAAVPIANDHARRTRTLAEAVLAADARQGWSLTEHPSRLAVYTIDALCAALVRQAPLSTGLGAAPAFEERATDLYDEAARTLLREADAHDPAWRCLLDHVENDGERLVELVAGLLAKREQWLPLLIGHDRGALRAALEDALRDEVAGELRTIRDAFPFGIDGAIAASLRDALRGFAIDAGRADRAEPLTLCLASGGLPPAHVEALSAWRALGQWLLTSNAACFRKSAGGSQGFPAAGDAKGAEATARKDAKRRMTGLLEDLARVEGLAEALHRARGLPDPTFTSRSWAVVEALLEVLPRAAAQLMLTFAAAGAIDFSAAALAARGALGTPDAPSDLLLRLDLRLQHLLLDEFQDTSFPQLDLIARLTAGWTPGDGRTLFAVGDPMQSIYRFREAEVRVFVEAQQHGRIAGVPVERLTLRRNFRSQRGIVDWVNAVFPQVLGTRSDPWRGSVAFEPAEAARDALPGDAVTMRLYRNDADEAAAVVAEVAAALADPDVSDVAILVRARSHLACVLPALRDAGIPFVAVELDGLADRPAVRDLASLTHALMQPADRLAWLSVLRAPWCGLTLLDLFAVAAHADHAHGRSLPDAVLDVDRVAGLGDDGRERLRAFAGTLAPSIASRGRLPLVQRVRAAWLALDGPATLVDAVDVEAARQFFALLAQHEHAGEVLDWPAFAAALEQLYAKPPAQAGTRVRVMTLHKAKGLQFDVVVVPGLGRCSANADPQLLRWRRRPGDRLLLAPSSARGSERDPIHDYLTRVAEEEERSELGRLLYVGCTRARRALRLTAVGRVDEDDDDGPGWCPPRSRSALACLWPAVGADVARPLPDVVSPAAAAFAPPPLLRFARPVRRDPPAPPVTLDPVDERSDALPYDWANATARHVGVVAHRVFAQIAADGLVAWRDGRLDASRGWIRVALQDEGVGDDALDDAHRQVAEAVRRLLQGPHGAFLFDPAHEDARSEWALTGTDDGAVVHVVLDRSFVAAGVRWIVDFKTGRHEGGDAAAFLAAEVERYRAQLDRYARIVRRFDARPIRLALCHPLIEDGFRDWDFEG